VELLRCRSMGFRAFLIGAEALPSAGRKNTGRFPAGMGALKPAVLPARYVVVGVASALAAAVFWLVYTWPVAVQYLPHFKVEYSNGVGRALQLEVVNETGTP
jgi:hypothetical protein